MSRANALRIKIPDLCETDEVHELRKLHLDLERKELYFAIILRVQHSLTICKVNFKDNDHINVSIQSKQLIREKEVRTVDLYDAVEVQPDVPTELQHSYHEALATEQMRLLYKAKQICLLTPNCLNAMNTIQKAMRLKLAKYGIPVPTQKEYV